MAPPDASSFACGEKLMNYELEDRVIRELAHALWEAEGRPSGRQDEHWYKAVRELAERTPAAKPNATRARRAKAPGARSKAA
jgi:hypothetical protein